jgi:hypothetical protein
MSVEDILPQLASTKGPTSAKIQRLVKEEKKSDRRSSGPIVSEEASPRAQRKLMSLSAALTEISPTEAKSSRTSKSLLRRSESMDKTKKLKKSSDSLPPTITSKSSYKSNSLVKDNNKKEKVHASPPPSTVSTLTLNSGTKKKTRTRSKSGGASSTPALLQPRRTKLNQYTKLTINWENPVIFAHDGATNLVESDFSLENIIGRTRNGLAFLAKHEQESYVLKFRVKKELKSLPRQCILFNVRYVLRSVCVCNRVFSGSEISPKMHREHPTNCSHADLCSIHV